MRQIGLGDIRMVIDQPKHGHLLLRQVQIRKGFCEMPVNSAMRQTNVKADNIADFADIIIAINWRYRDRERFFCSCHPQPSAQLLV
jgi:hypothetical protein